MGQKILVTGGAGYIGSHVCKQLHAAGFTPIVYDDLSNGQMAFVQWGPLVIGDVRDIAKFYQVVDVHRPVAIIHMAGLIEVGLSMKHPADFYSVNVGGSATVMSVASDCDIPVVFSSTCATFGAPVAPMNESHPQSPLNPYGRSKLMVDQIMRDMASTGFRGTILRYFNAAGASFDAEIGEAHDPETHAIPLMLAAALDAKPFKVFGTDYDTPDGTCIRDYVHVLDLADAHVRAVKQLLDGGMGDDFNLGSGTGYSVREVIDKISELTGLKLEVIDAPRREGDSPMLIADSSKALNELGWVPRYGLEEIVHSAYQWTLKDEY